MGSPGAGFEGGVAVEVVAGDQPRYPALADPAVAGDLGLAAAFDEYAVMTRRAFDTRGNLADQLFRCLETPYSEVLKYNTVPATKSPCQRIFPLAWFRFRRTVESVEVE